MHGTTVKKKFLRLRLNIQKIVKFASFYILFISPDDCPFGPKHVILKNINTQ